MFTRLRLRCFKNFEDATLSLGPFTLIAGANAAGKSNLRDAFRFLHGIGRGYGVADILGEKWSAGGVQVWSGMRGGLLEIAKGGSDTFSIEAELSGHRVYRVEISTKGGRPVIVDESRRQAAMQDFGSCRFLDLNPDAMRLPSVPGQVILGDRGDNLSSVLQALCADESKEAALLDWVRQLTPMDVTGFDFPADQTGRVLLTLVEADGRRTTAYSASDGTLRLLAMVAALLGPEPARFYFLEELENGIHPNRLALLIQLLESVTSQGMTQVVATTHSPQLLRLLSKESLENASVVYRLLGSNEGNIKRIIDIPDIRKVLETQDLARLHESGWLEDILNFSETPALV